MERSADVIREDLPDHLYWLADEVSALVRPAAFLLSGERHRRTGAPQTIAAQGSTFTNGAPDIPVGAAFASVARGAPGSSNGGWLQHPQDGESFVLQLNLADIPGVVRSQFPSLPAQGVVWVTAHTGRAGSWTGEAYFDPRPAQSIKWEARPADPRVWPSASRLVLADTMTYATDATLPQIASDYRDGGLAHDFDAWRDRAYGSRQRSDVQIGGWLHPIQGDDDEARKTLLATIGDQPFGDAGQVCLHYEPARGFFVELHTH